MNINLIKNLTEQFSGVTVVAATKGQSAQIICELAKAGLARVGENRVQELLKKYPLVEGVEWHFIGRLQTNKVKYIVDKVTMIQSLDRAALALEIEKQCAKRDICMDVLIELSFGEASKGGVGSEELHDLAELVSKQPHLRLSGLMCIPPVNAPVEVYEKAAQAFEWLKLHYETVKWFSMGMSDDYLTAIRFGANMIRPGRLLFK